ncbi:MAG: hypothetical protein JXB50_01410 [Spirochaetes bacterium]|nr:hypothetical protein [Spirochaetota bacterium]
MSFTEKDYLTLSYENRIKKLIFAVKQLFVNEKDADYVLSIAELFNKHEKFKIEIPRNNNEWQRLYDDLYSILLKENPFLEKEPFDLQKKQIFNKFKVKILFENIRSPFNVGSIIRSGEAFGIEEFLITGITCKPDSSKVKKTSRDVKINWNYYSNPSDIILKLKNEGHKIYSIEKTCNSVPINKYKFDFPCVIIFGNEEFGVSKEILLISDGIFHIEMYGLKKSLNVAAAAGIALYEITNQSKLQSEEIKF